jgi:hypothetical protein
MRKGVADFPRRAEVSQAANQRYLEAMATVDMPTPLKMLTEKPSQRIIHNGKPVRALNLLGQDTQLLEIIGQGEWILNGFRNRDLGAQLFPKPSADSIEQRRRSGKVTRQLRMPRAHGLIHKVPHMHRYLLSDKGRQIITALQAARAADIEKLSKAA